VWNWGWSFSESWRKGFERRTKEIWKGVRETITRGEHIWILTVRVVTSINLLSFIFYLNELLTRRLTIVLCRIISLGKIVICNNDVEISPTSECFPKSRGETWTVQFSSFELLEALLSGWNFTQRHPLRMDTVISNYTARGLSWKRWSELFAKGKGNDAAVRQRRDSANCFASSISLHSTSSVSHLIGWTY